MTAINWILMVVVAALSSTASAFFLNWGASNQETNPPYPAYYYHQRVLQAPTGYTEPPIPAIPVQVPLQAQLTPATVHNVQLVPCLCPVSQDYELEKNSQEFFNQHKTN
ncbi:uncharacterized protein LOC123014835 [Tribolium madens]|uniref:uncharacterized protein LOC123014835 n=1 Tax=Tribolium madens TaxID=41895 RepID=UPI001CF766B6|nr:uncharacterized protein LOC123014835 [Tribolium madens]